MKILVCSDLHNDTVALHRLMAVEADAYFLAGDLVNWAKGLDRMAGVLKSKADRVYVIPGNHESPRDISAFCEQHGFHDFHGQSVVWDGVHVAGLGCSSPTPFNTPGEYAESEFEARLAPFAGLAPLVMICHCPPKGSALDRAGPGLHFGSSAMRAFIERVQPAYFFCGHIHEAAGVAERIGGTMAVNVGKSGYVLDLGSVGR